MTIGLPKALLYYRYHVLWENFFNELGCKVINSGDTNKRILSDGINYSIDESCLPSKIFMGHVCSLIGKCDYILIPRIVSYSKNDLVCVKFNALYDIVRNTFEGVPLLHYSIDYKNGETEAAGFLKMGMSLGAGRLSVLRAYQNARRKQTKHEQEMSLQTKLALDSSEKLNILMVSHPYNTYDRLVGEPIVRLIEKFGGLPLYADSLCHHDCVRRSKEVSQSLYWLYNKELVGSIKLLEKQVHGVILLSAFPCGPDSLVNELVMRKQKDLPTIHIVLDELQGEAGLQTRIESFLDILSQRKGIQVS